MKSRIQSAVMLWAAAAVLSGIAVAPANELHTRANTQQSLSERSVGLPATAPHLGGMVPPCPTGSTCN